MMTTTTPFAISWPAIFGTVPSVAYGRNESARPQFKLVKTRCQIVAEFKQSQLSGHHHVYAKMLVKFGKTPFLGPVTTKIGSVIYGNVTKTLYHRYFCTTRNW
ncbi:MAG TPA: hypothetical protein V6C86_09430 [Oculatellaceae cyanobacterium]